MKKLNIHIYILAYNEEENIEQLLLSLYRQKVTAYSLTGISVITDGSTDATVHIVKRLIKNHKNLSLIIHKENKGKLFRLNQIFAKNKADIAVILDSDIALVGNQFIQNLCNPFLKSPKPMIVAAASEMIMPKNFIGKLVASSFLTWDYIRLRIPKGDSVHNFSSQATAYRGSFVKKLHIPKAAVEERIYLYLMAKNENKNGFFYNAKAVYKFIPPSSFKDLSLMTKRPFGKKQTEVDNIFGFDTESILTVSKKDKIVGLATSFVKHPLLTPFGLVLNSLIPKLSLRNSPDSSKWERSTSTKRRLE